MPTTGATLTCAAPSRLPALLNGFPGRNVQEAHPARSKMKWMGCDEILWNLNEYRNKFQHFLTTQEQISFPIP